ncbi:MAG: hypothetical protein RL414_1224 [Actinomycetota bacterium]|jgi:hypothetical protein
MWEIIPSQEITVGTSRERLQMRFIIFVIDGPGNPANPNEMADIDAFNEKLQSNGHWITAAGIRDTKSAKVIDNRSGKNEVIEGSLFSGPEHYSGFWLIEASNTDEAQQLALEGSQACNRKVELRPYIQ